MSDNKSDVVVVDFWANGFGMRVRIALEEKGIKYKYKEEDLRISQRSQLVLEMNPVRKSVPILIHKENPVCDSAVIFDFIDEMWKADGSVHLLPEDACERALTRFWVHFIDNKHSNKILKSKGEAKEQGKNELLADLKLLEGFLGDKLYFGGNKFGLFDIAFIPFSSMFNGYESDGNFKLEVECPKLTVWVKRCIARESVSKVLPNSVEMYELHKKWYGIE